MDSTSGALSTSFKKIEKKLFAILFKNNYVCNV